MVKSSVHQSLITVVPSWAMTADSIFKLIILSKTRLFSISTFCHLNITLVAFTVFSIADEGKSRPPFCFYWVISYSLGMSQDFFHLGHQHSSKVHSATFYNPAVIEGFWWHIQKCNIKCYLWEHFWAPSLWIGKLGKLMISGLSSNKNQCLRVCFPSVWWKIQEPICLINGIFKVCAAACFAGSMLFLCDDSLQCLFELQNIWVIVSSSRLAVPFSSQGGASPISISLHKKGLFSSDTT